jgi:hypothetical protein
MFALSHLALVNVVAITPLRCTRLVGFSIRGRCCSCNTCFSSHRLQISSSRLKIDGRFVSVPRTNYLNRHESCTNFESFGKEIWTIGGHYFPPKFMSDNFFITVVRLENYLWILQDRGRSCQPFMTGSAKHIAQRPSGRSAIVIRLWSYTSQNFKKKSDSTVGSGKKHPRASPGSLTYTRCAKIESRLRHWQRKQAHMCQMYWN